MELGCFSISLNVKDISASKEFYEKLGFTAYAGDISQNWIMMKNGNTNIGLFQGMFDKNILTFNPGWDQDAKEIGPFTDIRVIQEDLRSKGIRLDSEADPATKGPASIIITDPDGNPILIDQHI
jgi:catechol 2,3-dioxygenase-like lactoylglutathione lyase family enzyme